MTAIGKVITRLTKSRGWSQGKLALYSGVAKGTISYIEAGQRTNPGARVLAGVADALDASVDDILQEAGMMKARADRGNPSAEERMLLDAIRSTADLAIRVKLIKAMTDMADVVRVASEGADGDHKEEGASIITDGAVRRVLGLRDRERPG